MALGVALLRFSDGAMLKSLPCRQAGTIGL